MNRPTLSPQRTRERAVFLYRSALGRGDFDTVMTVLKLAERDPLLMQMIEEVAELDEEPALRPEKQVSSFYREAKGITQSVIRRDPSPNGSTPKPEHHEEESKMQTIYSDTVRRGKYGLNASFLTVIAASIMFILLGTLLYRWISEPIGSYGALIDPSPTPSLASCQVVNTADLQAESIRLAEAGSTVLAAEQPDAELSTLLGICALQTAYTAEANSTLQQAMSIDGAVQTFPGNDIGGVFSPDGRYLLTGDNTLVRMWDVTTGEDIREFVGHTDYVLALAFSPDGRYALSGSADKTVRLWDVETGEEIRQFVGHLASLLTVTFSPNGRYVLSAGDDGTPRLWDVETGEEIRQFVGHRTSVYGAVFSPDGRYVATGGSDGTVRLWEVATGDELRQFQPFSGFAGGIAFSSDGTQLLNSGAYAVRLSDVETGETIREYTSQGSRVLGFPSFSPDGRYVLASDRDKRLALLWDAETGELIRSFDARVFDTDARRVYNVSFSPDGRLIVIGTSHGQNPHRIWLWDTDYHDSIAHACSKVTRDFTAEESAQYGLSDSAPTCPQFGQSAELQPGMTAIPTQPIPVWTPIPTTQS